MVVGARESMVLTSSYRLLPLLLLDLHEFHGFIGQLTHRKCQRPRCTMVSYGDGFVEIIRPRYPPSQYPDVSSSLLQIRVDSLGS